MEFRKKIKDLEGISGNKEKLVVLPREFNPYVQTCKTHKTQRDYFS
jgi:hypothetical protein